MATQDDGFVINMGDMGGLAPLAGTTPTTPVPATPTPVTPVVASPAPVTTPVAPFDPFANVGDLPSLTKKDPIGIASTTLEAPSDMMQGMKFDLPASEPVAASVADTMPSFDLGSTDPMVAPEMGQTPAPETAPISPVAAVPVSPSTDEAFAKRKAELEQKAAELKAQQAAQKAAQDEKEAADKARQAARDAQQTAMQAQQEALRLQAEELAQKAAALAEKEQNLQAMPGPIVAPVQSPEGLSMPDMSLPAGMAPTRITNELDTATPPAVMSLDALAAATPVVSEPAPVVAPAPVPMAVVSPISAPLPPVAPAQPVAPMPYGLWSDDPRADSVAGAMKIPGMPANIIPGPVGEVAPAMPAPVVPVVPQQANLFEAPQSAVAGTNLTHEQISALIANLAKTSPTAQAQASLTSVKKEQDLTGKHNPDDEHDHSSHLLGTMLKILAILALLLGGAFYAYVRYPLEVTNILSIVTGGTGQNTDLPVVDTGSLTTGDQATDSGAASPDAMVTPSTSGAAASGVNDPFADVASAFTDSPQTQQYISDLNDIIMKSNTLVQEFGTMTGAIATPGASSGASSGTGTSASTTPQALQQQAQALIKSATDLKQQLTQGGQKLDLDAARVQVSDFKDTLASLQQHAQSQ